MALNSVAVVVPVLNEASQIEQLLTDLTSAHDFAEVWVVDGGSTDRTLALAARFAGVRVTSAPTGRAAQMNVGAARAAAEILLFLHADVRLPPHAVAHIRRAMADPKVHAGAFRTWTLCDDPQAPYRWLAPLLHLADLRSRVTRVPYGDQALFVRRSSFLRVGGYPELPLLEDLALSTRLRELGPIARVPASVRVSGRRFVSRPLYYTVAVNFFPLLYRCGVPAQRLAGWYRPVRSSTERG